MESWEKDSSLPTDKSNCHRDMSTWHDLLGSKCHKKTVVLAIQQKLEAFFHLLTFFASSSELNNGLNGKMTTDIRSTLWETSEDIPNSHGHKSRMLYFYNKEK